MSVRLRFALLYAGAFLVSGLLVLSVAFLAVSSTKEAGTAGAPVVKHPFAQTIEPALPLVATILLVLALLSVALGWLLATRLLRPVRLMTAAARDISASNLSRRLRPGRRDDEFGRLGQTLNDLLARLEASFQAQRHFVANASHELRTPLTAERTLLQVALADPQVSQATLREACEQVLALGTRTERLIDALLTLATGERGIERREPLDLADLAGRVVRTRGELAARCQVRLDATLAPARTAGDPGLAESLIANLADNALRYNVPGGSAEVSTATFDGHAVLSVRNTGAVVPASEVDRLFQPFQRLGADRVQRPASSGHGLGDGLGHGLGDGLGDGLGHGLGDGLGHGLGLAIVRAIADAHGAAVTARAREGGGLEIAVAFPRESPGIASGPPRDPVHLSRTVPGRLFRNTAL